MNSPKRILIHGMTGNPGGIESCIMNYYRNINPGNIHFDFLCINQKPAYYQEIIDRGSKVYVIPGRRRYISHYRELITVFKENNYDGFWSNRCSLPGTVLLFKIAHRYEVPLRIIHAHSTRNLSHWFSGGLFHIIERYRIRKHVTNFWACSKMAGKYCYGKKIMQLANFQIIHNAIDVNKFRFNKASHDDVRKDLLLSDKLVIGHIGSFFAVKNHVFLIRVFHEIYKKESNAVLLLIGDGKLRSVVENMVKALNLSRVIHFLGIRSDIPALLNAMDVFILPSKSEGLPNVLIEAQAASLHSFVSINVSSESAITNLLSFIDLKKTPEEWAELILAKRNYVREDMSKEMQKAGYDIKMETVKVEQYLLDRFNYT